MNTPPLRWAIVGTGKISSQFAWALAQTPGHERHAVISRDTTRAAEFARAHGFARALMLDETVFRNPDIDVFYIGAPTEAHRDLCLQAIEAGKPVLCEKPMTGAAQDFEAVRTAAGARAVFAMEAMWLKFNPLIRRIAERLKSGAAGKLLAASMQVGYRDRTAEDRVVAPAADALTVFGCYAAALALDFFGTPLRVFASGRKSPAGEGVVHAHVVLEYADFSFSFECSVVTELANALSIHGELERISIPLSVLDPHRLEIQSTAPMRRAQKLLVRLSRIKHALADAWPFAHPLRGSGFRGEIAEVGLRIRQRQGESSLHPLQSTRQAHQIIEAARRSVDTGLWQRLP